MSDWQSCGRGPGFDCLFADGHNWSSPLHREMNYFCHVAIFTEYFLNVNDTAKKRSERDNVGISASPAMA
jgi:hypothetical protein